MTKKDYELIVQVLSGVRAMSDSDSVSYTKICRNMAFWLQTDNSRFDQERFLAACGVPLTNGKEV